MKSPSFTNLGEPAFPNSILQCTVAGSRHRQVLRRFYVFDDDLLKFDIGFRDFEYAFHWIEIDMHG